MDSREICVWLDRRWYEALSRQLKKEDMTVEEKLDEYLDTLIDQLPRQVYEKISREIWEEDQRQRQEAEADKKFSAFHVREHGQEEYFQLERSWDVLDAASTLRSFLRSERRGSFSDFCGIRQRITAEEFDQLVGAHMENPQKVTGAFALDFDKKEFSSVDAADGWRTYPMRDVSTAVYRAFQAEGLSSQQRMARFTERLAGREIESAKQVCGGLEVNPCRADGREEAVRYAAVFRITQNGRTAYSMTINDKPADTLDTALLLRAYLLYESNPSRQFMCTIPESGAIPPEVFCEYADEMRQGSGEVTAALDIDLDRGTFSTMAGADGWQTYAVSDVLSAAWNATIPHWSEREERRCIFAEQLEGKLIDQEAVDITPPAGLTM